MDYLELRKIIGDYQKYAGTVKISRSPIVHDGFHGNFNMSFAEEPYLKKFGNYLDQTEDYNFSTIQQVIRVNDLKNLDDTHLLLFDMADISGFIGKTNALYNERNDIANFTIRKTFGFFINELKLKPENFFISYLAGGEVKALTGGKYTFDKYIDADPFIKTAKEYGISEKNFIPDKSRTTLLALNFTPPVAWGYRNEIFYKTDKFLLDIASIENLLWRPIYKTDRIADIATWEHFMSFQVVGIERLLMLLNGFEKIYEADHIKPLIENVGQYSDKSCRILAEMLRCFHRIVADVKSFSNLSCKRKRKLIPYRRNFLQNCIKIDFNYKERLKDLLMLNSKLQPCYPELSIDIESYANEIIEWLGRGKIS